MNFKQTISMIQHENSEAVKALGRNPDDVEKLMNNEKYELQTQKLLAKLDKTVNGLADSAKGMGY